MQAMQAAMQARLQEAQDREDEHNLIRKLHQIQMRRSQGYGLDPSLSATPTLSTQRQQCPPHPPPQLQQPQPQPQPQEEQQEEDEEGQQQQQQQKQQTDDRAKGYLMLPDNGLLAIKKAWDK